MLSQLVKDWESVTTNGENFNSRYLDIAHRIVYIGKDSYVHMRITADSPTLLKYQEYVCEK